MKGMYFEKQMGDGTSVSVIRSRREDDGRWALAFRYRFDGKMLTCFLEDADGVCFVDELTDALVDYLDDKTDEGIEESEEKGKTFIRRKEAEKKNSTDKDESISAEVATITQETK